MDSVHPERQELERTLGGAHDLERDLRERRTQLDADGVPRQERADDAVTLRPLAPLPCARIALTGLRVGDGTIDVTVDEGAVSVQVNDAGVKVAIEAGR